MFHVMQSVIQKIAIVKHIVYNLLHKKKEKAGIVLFSFLLEYSGTHRFKYVKELNHGK